MGDFYIGGIILFGGNFAPREFAFCMGQLQPISQNQALFAILGTTWGGDGRTNYSLPDLRGRVPAGVGQGPGLSDMPIGFRQGANITELQVANMPEHNHAATFFPTGGGSGTPITATVTVNAKSGTGNQNSADNGYWASGISGLTPITSGYSSTSDTVMADDAVVVNVTGGGGGITGGSVVIGETGGSAAFSIMQPTLGIQFIIAMQGVFPPRN